MYENFSYSFGDAEITDFFEITSYILQRINDFLI